jgi:hypothetical protein
MAAYGKRDRTRGPDFFIVGAAKAGTTSLDRYLSAHPEIFMCKKEPHQFGSDLDFGPAWRGGSWDEYLFGFAGAGDARRLGETSPGYLVSTRAAEEIKAYRPDARIIVMLRNPVDAIAALHASLLYVGDEDIEDFGQALAAEPERRLGRSIPATNELAFALRYREMVRYRAQLERYLDVFGHERLHVVIYDDFCRDTLDSYRRTLEFLEVDPGFEPTFEVANANHKGRIRALGIAYSKAYLPSPPGWRTAWRAARLAIPSHRARVRLYERIMRWNTVYESRSELQPALRRQLEAELTDEVAALGTLVGRDLSHWVRRSGVGVPSPGGPPTRRHPIQTVSPHS